MDEAAPQAAGASAATVTLTEQELAALRYGWGDAYKIEWDAERGWRAVRRDGEGGDITADGPDALWQAINEDYALKPVPRNLPSEAMP